MRKIVFITFLNDYSGSPKMLSIIVENFIKKKYQVEVITNRSNGHLSNIKAAKYSYVHYKYIKSNNILTSIYFILAQIELFFKVLFKKSANTIFYINTITPIGAVWACKLSKKKYIYHVHEDMNLKKSLYALYRFTYIQCNTKSIFVSNYLAKNVKYCHDYKVIYNCLDDHFIKQANKYIQLDFSKRHTILLISSLRKYKGIYTFLELAKNLVQYQFEMVLSSSQIEVNEFIRSIDISDNVKIYSISTNLHPYYRRAKILLSLTNPKYCIESFGLTILEAMSYGIPAIVPNIGGPTELIHSGENGFCIDVTNLKMIQEYVILLMGNYQLYSSFANSALQESKKYSCTNMINQIEEYIYD